MPLLLLPALQAARLTWAREGLGGFYKGLAPALIRVMPQSALTMVVYENVLRLIQQQIQAQAQADAAPGSAR